MKFIVPSHLPDYGQHRQLYAELGTAGFSVLLNFTREGPEYLESTYPQKWQEEYDAGHYYYRDPVLLWAMGWNGDKRWSSVPFPDVARVMKRARLHGLGFGCAFSRVIGKNKSLLSVARPDREFTDAEMLSLSESFDLLVCTMGSDRTLTRKELDALQCLANDMNLDAAAGYLGVSVAAVKARLLSARSRLGAETNYHAVAVALRTKLIQ